MFYPNCGNQILYGGKFCGACGYAFIQNQTVQNPSYVNHLPNGITQDQDGFYYWQGDCPAISYKAIFTVSRWAIGIVGAFVLFIIIMIFSDESLADAIKPAFVTLGIIIGVYLVTASCLLIARGGRFYGNFRLSDDDVSVYEEVHSSKNPFLIALSCLFAIFMLLFSLLLIFSDTGGSNGHLGGSLNMSVSRSVRYNKIQAVIPSVDKKKIRLKKSVGSLWLLVTPEQCDFVIAQINYRRNHNTAKGNR